MVTRRLHNENANAEILGVVILIGIFAITAGIISATTLASPQPMKVPAASIEIVSSSDGIQISHLGGDLLDLESMVVRGTEADGTPAEPIVGTSAIQTWFGDPTITTITNGFSRDVATDWLAVVLSWQGGSGESVIASWDPNGIYGPIGPPAPPGGSVPSPIPTPVVQPPIQFPATVQNIIADFSASPSAVGVGEKVQFMDLSIGDVKITNWSWDFGDGSTSMLQNPEHYYDGIGNYTVSLTVSNLSFGANATAVKNGYVQVSVMPGPVDFDIAPDPPERGVALTVVCTDISSSSPTLWRWTATDGLTGSETTIGPVALNESYNPKIQTFTFYNPSGMTDNVCTIKMEIWSPYFASPISITKNVTVGPPLHAEFVTTLPNWTGVAGNDPVQFQDISVGFPQAWHWDFGDGGVSTEQNPVHPYTVGPNEIKTFNVTLTVSGWGQEDSVNHTVTIYPAVSAKSKAEPNQGSAPLTVQFTDLSTGFPDHWRWNFTDGSPINTLQNPVHTFTNVGKYKVALYSERSEPHSVAPNISEVLILVGDEVFANFSGSPLYGEAPLSVQFTDLSVNAEYWAWEFGDGQSSIDQNPVNIYNTPGNYTVKLTADNIYRFDVEEKIGYVSAFGPITASFTGTPLAVEVGSPVRFSDTSTGNPYNWAWDFGDSTTSAERNPTHTYSTAGTYDVSLTAINPLYTGKALEPDYITVYDRVDASFTANPTSGLAPLTVQFTDTSTGSPTSWSWAFGDGTTTDEQSPLHTYDEPGNYSVTLTASHAYDDDVTMAINLIVSVWGPLGAQFTTNQSAGPGPLTVQFNDTSEGNPVAWLWDFGDGTSSTERNPLHTYAASGSYDVILTASHPQGSIVSAPYTITVYDPLAAQFSADQSSGVAPFSVKLSTIATGGEDKWRWEFGDGLTSTEQDPPAHRYDAPGVYTANLTTWNSLRPDLTATSSQTIVAYGVPQSAFDVNKRTGSAPVTVQFTDRSTGIPTSWFWNFGDNTTSTDQNPSHTFTESGRAYTVRLTVGNPAGNDPTPASQTINVM